MPALPYLLTERALQDTMNAMQRSIRRISPRTIAIHEGKQIWLGISIAASVKPAMLVGWSLAAADHGLVVDGSKIRNWKPEGCIEYENDLYVRGPWIEGRRLSEVFLQDKSPPVAKLITALGCLKNNNQLPSSVHWDCVEYTEQGQFFFFPDSAVNHCIQSQNNTDPDSWQGQTVYVGSPVFCLASILYRHYTQVYPFAFLRDIPQSHNYIRNGYCLPPHLREPRLREAASTTISKGLQEEASLEDFSLFCDDAAIFHSTEVDASEQPPATTLEEIHRHEKKLRALIARKEFFRTRWRILAILGVIGALVFAIGQTVVRNLLKPPLTQGLSAEAMIQGYYASINTLDHEYLRDALAKELPDTLVSELIQLSVTTKIRSVYESQFQFLSAQEWIDAGKPAVDALTLVYGVTDVQIQKLSANRFQVDYEYWRSTETGLPENLRISELLVLEQRAQDQWIIIEQERSMDAQ